MIRTATASGAWEPASPAEVAALFASCDARWWIAGGYAIELAVGRPLREHGDIDVLMLRPDQLAAQRALPGWEWWAADPPGALRPWAPGEILPAPVHDIWCRPASGAPWRIQVMLDEAEQEHWVSRRDPAVRRPIHQLGALSPDGIPYLSPEIELYYKAKNPRPKDEQDFAAVLPHLDERQRQWLDEALASTYGRHSWRERTNAARRIRQNRT